MSRPSAAQEDRDPAPVAPAAGEGGALSDQVDPRSGAMTYTYRFDLPAARGLAGPSGALQYNYSTRDREAGYGWGLDVRSIERRPVSGLPRFDSAGLPIAAVAAGVERDLFQGQPLVRICQVGEACPNEALTQGHPSWATVEFGAPTGQTYGLPEALERKSPGILRWRPVIRRDLQHPDNVVVYRWQPHGTRGILYLTHIYDTPSLSAPTATNDFAHHTELSWEGVPYPAGNHQGPETAMSDFRLKRVGVASKSWSALGAREIYDLYRLDYMPTAVEVSTIPPSKGRSGITHFSARFDTKATALSSSDSAWTARHHRRSPDGWSAMLHSYKYMKCNT